MTIYKTDASFFPPKDMDNLKNMIKMVWDSIPKSQWDLCIRYKGRRIDIELLHKIPKVNRQIKWEMKSPEINDIRASYNDKFVLKLMNKNIRDKKRAQLHKKK